MAHFQHSVIHIVDLIADDHLILSACLHDLDHAVGGLQNFLVCLALVLQLEAQTGDAVRHGDDVALAANILDNNARKAVVFTCHKPVLLFTLFVCLFGQFKAQPPVAQTDGCRKRQSRQRRRVRKAFVLERHGNAAAPPGGGDHVRLTAHKGKQLIQQSLPGFCFLQRDRTSFLSGHTKSVLHIQQNFYITHRPRAPGGGYTVRKQKSPNSKRPQHGLLSGFPRTAARKPA